MVKNPKFIERPERRHRNLSPNEAQLWKKVTDDVAALPGRMVELDDIEPMEEPVATRPYPDRAVPLPTHRAETSERGLHKLDHGRAAGVDKRTMERLARGKMPIEGRLDLHGMTQDQAHSALMRFISTGYQHGKRCVVVVTGKGTRLTGEIGVLRQMVPHWLNQPGLRSKIIAFTHAPKKDGGEGALYILLKRWR